MRSASTAAAREKIRGRACGSACAVGHQTDGHVGEDLDIDGILVVLAVVAEKCAFADVQCQRHGLPRSCGVANRCGAAHARPPGQACAGMGSARCLDHSSFKTACIPPARGNRAAGAGPAGGAPPSPPAGNSVAYSAQAGPVAGLSAAEREELTRLRRENKQLRLERDILSKAAAWFARETGTLPSGSSGS